jgi:hypothetical protein
MRQLPATPDYFHCALSGGNLAAKCHSRATLAKVDHPTLGRGKSPGARRRPAKGRRRAGVAGADQVGSVSRSWFVWISRLVAVLLTDSSRAFCTLIRRATEGAFAPFQPRCRRPAGGVRSAPGATAGPGNRTGGQLTHAIPRGARILFAARKICPGSGRFRRGARRRGGDLVIQSMTKSRGSHGARRVAGAVRPPPRGACTRRC